MSGVKQMMAGARDGFKYALFFGALYGITLIIELWARGAL